MNNYVIVYDALSGKGLLTDYDQTKGKNPKEALKNFFGVDFKRMTGDNARYSEVIMVKGSMEGNTIRYAGRYTQLCYSRI